MSASTYTGEAKGLKPYTLRMPIGMIEELKLYADERDSDVSTLIRRSVTNFLREKSSS